MRALIVKVRQVLELTVASCDVFFLHGRLFLDMIKKVTSSANCARDTHRIRLPVSISRTDGGTTGPVAPTPLDKSPHLPRVA